MKDLNSIALDTCVRDLSEVLNRLVAEGIVISVEQIDVEFILPSQLDLIDPSEIAVEERLTVPIRINGRTEESRTEVKP